MASRTTKASWKASVSLPADATFPNPCTNVRNWAEVTDQGIPTCHPELEGMVIHKLELIAPPRTERRAAPARKRAGKVASRKASPKRKRAKRGH